MRKLILLWSTLCATALLMSASPVRAQLYVANEGSDANTCLRAAPCATFQRVLTLNPDYPWIVCLNSSSYGPFTVTASIIVDCTGSVGTVATGGGTNGITINAPSGATVILRNLSIVGYAAGGNGISTTAIPNGKLIVENCMISGFGSYGINFVPGGGRGTLQVSNSQMLNNTHGIVVAPPAGQIASVTLDHVELASNSNGGLIFTGAGVAAGTMRHGVAASNGLYGVYSDVGQAYFTIEESSIVANLTSGIQTNSAGSLLKVGASTIGGNGTGVKVNAGSIVSFGNNQMSDNGANGNFTSTIALR